MVHEPENITEGPTMQVNGGWFRKWGILQISLVL